MTDSIDASTGMDPAVWGRIEPFLLRAALARTGGVPHSGFDPMDLVQDAAVRLCASSSTWDSTGEALRTGTLEVNAGFMRQYRRFESHLSVSTGADG